MDRGTDLVFVLNIVGIFVAFGLLAWFYIWPRLRVMPRNDALKRLILLHTFRFLGLSFLIVGVVSPDLPSKIAIPAAWGDFGAATLALLAFSALHRRWSLAMLLVWLFEVWGSLDLLYAYVNGIRYEIDPGLLGAAYYIPTVVVPALLVSHTLIFRLLNRPVAAA